MPTKNTKLIQCCTFCIMILLLFSCGNHESPNTYQKQENIPSEKLSNENIKVNFHVFIYPGLKLDNHEREIREELDLLRDRLNVSLSTTIFERPLDRSLFPQTPSMFMNNLEKQIDEGKVDLFYSEKSDKEIDELINNGKLIKVDALIKEHAPNLYNTYPEAFWTYRKNTGDMYGIPLRNYDEINRKGFWIIDKMYNGGTYEIRNPQELIDILQKTEQPDISMQNYFRNFLMSNSSNPAINKKNTRNICLTYSYLIDDMLNLTRYPVFGQNEFYLENGAVEITFLNREIKSMLNKIIPVVKKAVYTPLFNDPRFKGTLYKDFFFHTGWSCVKISFDENIKPEYSTQYDQIKNVFTSEKYFYVSDLNFMVPSPFTSNRFLYIPQSSQKAIYTIKMIDELYSNPYWYDLFVYGVENFPGMPKHEYDVPGSSFYDNSYRMALAKLVNSAHHRIPAYYPESVKQSYVDFIEQQLKIDGQYSIPIEQIYKHTLEDMDMRNYIDEIVVTRALLSDSLYNNYPKEIPKTRIEQIQQELQKRIDNYLRNI